ncbi:MAG: glycosyltransferase, partial [Hydrogenothermaceae bacterium]
DGSFFLNLIGGGPDEKKLVKRIASLNYKITPFVNDPYELAKLYNSADAFITCSKSDTYGISVLEAQSCGLPVFAYRNTSFEELTLYKEFLAKDKYEMIEKLLSFKNNQTVISRQNLHRFISLNFSMEDSFNKLIKIYKQIVNKN